MQRKFLQTMAHAGRYLFPMRSFLAQETYTFSSGRATTLSTYRLYIMNTDVLVFQFRYYVAVHTLEIQEQKSVAPEEMFFVYTSPFEARMHLGHVRFFFRSNNRFLITLLAETLVMISKMPMNKYLFADP